MRHFFTVCIISLAIVVLLSLIGRHSNTNKYKCVEYGSRGDCVKKEK